jgi:(2Fe-2S) ferredoxin
MALYAVHAFICTSGSTCPLDGDAAGVHKTLKDLVATHPEQKNRIRVNHAGCLNQCGHGPMMVVYPEDVWYHHLTPDKVREIFEQHLVGGVPVERYVYRNPPGAHKVPRDANNQRVESACKCPNH